MEELLPLSQNTNIHLFTVFKAKVHTHMRNGKRCTLCGEGRGALLDGIELQQQAVQLRQVATQQ